MLGSLKLIKVCSKRKTKNMVFIPTLLCYFSGKIFLNILLPSDNKEINKISKPLLKLLPKLIKIKYLMLPPCRPIKEFKKK